MKRFKVIVASGAQEFEDELNQLAAEGWAPMVAVSDYLVLGQVGSMMSEIAEQMDAKVSGRQS